jgi:hypothetical protein
MELGLVWEREGVTSVFCFCEELVSFSTFPFFVVVVSG